VKRLPELLKDFEVVVKDKTFTDVDEAAQAVETVRPMSADLPKT